MSQNNTKETKVISVRDLTPHEKDRIRSLLRHGDHGKIAIMVKSVGYQQVINVLNPNHPSDSNDEVWECALEYLSGLPKVEMDVRFAKYISNEEKEDGVAA